MCQYYDVLVAQYGHPNLQGAKHWAIIVVTDPQELTGWAYQIEGSTQTYKVKAPQEVRVLDSDTYMGSVKVGCIDTGLTFGSDPRSLHTILMNNPVVKGDLQWNCQNWVVGGLERLKGAQHDINQVTVQGLQNALADAKRDSYE
jgi:hypothetical protein